MGYIQNKNHFINYISKCLDDHNLELDEETKTFVLLKVFYDRSESISDYMKEMPHDTLAWELKKNWGDAEEIGYIFRKVFPRIMREIEEIYLDNKIDKKFDYIKVKRNTKVIQIDKEEFDRRNSTQPELTCEAERELETLSKTPGIYFLHDEFDRIIYIGKSKSLQSRITSSLKDKKASKFSYLIAKTEADIHILEPYLISLYGPEQNKDLLSYDQPSFTIPVPEMSKVIKGWKEDK